MLEETVKAREKFSAPPGARRAARRPGRPHTPTASAIVPQGAFAMRANRRRAGWKGGWRVRARGSDDLGSDSGRVRRDKIYLVGFLAAGKSTMARALGSRLDWRVEDIDELIETRERRTVADIFATKGEAYFRAVERDVLRGVLPPRHVVVATGAGTFDDVENRAAINGDGTSVWLDVPWPRLLDRLPSDGRRPMASDRETMERLYQMRRLAYRQAQIRIDAASAPVEELVERTLDRLGY